MRTRIYDPQGWDQPADILPLGAKYAGLEVLQVRQMTQLQEENLRFKQHFVMLS
jgi:hypothetical protein